MLLAPVFIASIDVASQWRGWEGTKEPHAFVASVSSGNTKMSPTIPLVFEVCRKPWRDLAGDDRNSGFGSAGSFHLEHYVFIIVIIIAAARL